MPTDPGDSRFLTTRHPASCPDCRARVARGERALYWRGPLRFGSRSIGAIYCAPCGEPRYRLFLAEAADEAVFGCGADPYAA